MEGGHGAYACVGGQVAQRRGRVRRARLNCDPPCVDFFRSAPAPRAPLSSCASRSTLFHPLSQSGAYKVSGTMTAPVPAHVVWDVLTDFDNQVKR